MEVVMANLKIFYWNSTAETERNLGQQVNVARAMPWLR
jgi:hypothetical protein